MRFRARSWNIPWGLRRASSNAHLEWLNSALPEECIKANSTQQVCRDPNQEEEKELEAFPKRSTAEKESILAQRRQVRTRLLGPQTAVASSSVAPTALNASASNPTLVKGGANTRKRQRRDSIQSSTSEEFNQSTLKRRRLQSGSDAKRDDEQACSSGIPPAHGPQRRHDDQIRRVDYRNREPYRTIIEPGCLNSPNMEHHQGRMPTRDLVHPSKVQRQCVEQNAANKRMLDNTQHQNSAVPSTAYQPMLGHPQPQESGITYDHHHVDPKLKGIDDAEDDGKNDAEDAPSNLSKYVNAAFDQAPETVDLESSQPQAGADDIAYMNDIQDAPAGFWDAVDPAAHQLQEEPAHGSQDEPAHRLQEELAQQLPEEPDSLTDDQQRISNTEPSVELEVGKSYMIIWPDERKVSRGLIDANGPNEFERLSIATAIHEVASLAVELNRDAASQKAGGKQPETSAEPLCMTTYLQVGKRHIIVCIEERRACEGVTAAGGDTSWDEIPLQAVVEALAGASQEPTIRGDSTHIGAAHDPGSTDAPSPLRQPATDVAYAGNATTNVAPSTVPSSSPNPYQFSFRDSDGALEVTCAEKEPAKKEPAMTDDAKASLAKILAEWQGDSHYLASVQHRAATRNGITSYQPNGENSIFQVEWLGFHK